MVLKKRLALPLVRVNGAGALELAGFGWMGPIVPTENEPQIPGARTSFAVRIYESAAGKGLATPYCRAIVQAHQILYGVGGEWLEAWGDNERALKPYRHVGFEEVARIPGNRHGEVVDRVYMTLGDISDY